MDEAVEELLLGAGVPVGDGVADFGSQRVEFGLGGSFVGGGVNGGGEFAAPVAQSGGLGGEGLDSLAAGRFGEAAGFEGEQVALDGFFGLAQLGFDHVEFFAEALLLFAGSFPPAGQRSLEQVGLAVGVEEAVEDGLVELGSAPVLVDSGFAWVRPPGMAG